MSLLARLIEAGTPADLIEEVAMLVAEKRAAEKAITERREAEAARTARYREKGGGQIVPAVRAEVFRRDDYTCQDCGATDNLSCDHIIPVSKGGGSEVGNLQVLCTPCNSRKRDRIRKRDERSSGNIQGQTRTKGQSGDSPTDPSPSPSPNENNSNPHPHPHPDNTTRARKGSAKKPEDVSDQVWSDFLDLRKAKKAPVSETVIDTMRREAGKVGWSLEEAMAATVGGGWQGFRARYVEDEHRRSTGPPAANVRPLRGSSIADLLVDVRQAHGL